LVGGTQAGEPAANNGIAAGMANIQNV